MAVDLFSYTSYEKDQAQRIVEGITGKYRLFAAKLLIAAVAATSVVDNDIASKYGIAARSRFLIKVNDKQATDLIPQVANAVRNSLGAGNVVVLFENEQPL